MITYSCSYDGTSRPVLTQNFTASSGEVFVVPFNAYSTYQQLDEVETDLISAHMDNLLIYVQDMSNTLSYPPFDANSIPNGKVVTNSNEIQWALSECESFWAYMRFNRWLNLLDDEEI